MSYSWPVDVDALSTVLYMYTHVVIGINKFIKINHCRNTTGSDQAHAVAY